MAVDYLKTRDTVKRMIDAYGRPITLINDSPPADNTDPLGPPGVPTIVPDVVGVFVRPSGYIKLGESFYMDPGMWEEAEKIVLILPSLTEDYARFTRVLETDSYGQEVGFKIFKVEELKPGNIPLLLYLGLKQ